MSMLQKQMETHRKESQVSEVHISYASASLIKEKLGKLKLVSDEDWLDAKEWIGNQLAHHLPSETVKALALFGRNVNQGAIVIRGMPIDQDLPPTPYKGYEPPQSIPLISAIHLGIYHLVGINPIAYQNENRGLLFRHVVPATVGREQKSSHGSKLTFGFHVDNPDLPLAPEILVDRSGCPEFLSLMAVRSDLQVRSSVVMLDSVLESLNRGVIEHLCMDEFLISRPDSFVKGKNTRLPLLVFDNDNIPYCRYDKENTVPLTPRAAAALVMFEAALDKQENQLTTLFLPGDLLLIRNQRTFHRREGYQPRDDGADRWLVRLFGMSSKEKLLPVAKNKQHIGID